MQVGIIDMYLSIYCYEKGLWMKILENIALSGKKVYAMKIWEFFENMNECVYASDIDTDELVYMNKKHSECTAFIR